MSVLRWCLWINAALAALVIIAFVLLPGVRVWRDLGDAGLQEPRIPAVAWRLHADLTPRYERWARARLRSSRAAELSTSNISGTEWPLFGSVFYLWATEALQEAWAAAPQSSSVAPAQYARGAIDAAAALVLDPSQAGWVQRHWGDAYRSRENAFYRMLLISAATAHVRLTGERRYAAELGEQVEGLAAELLASPHGLLEDYPGECYPSDVLAAVAAIRRADTLLGTNHAAFVEQARRAFMGELLDARGLVPYAADAHAGRALGWSRGCGNSYVSLMAPELWPDLASAWYGRYVEHFWQERWTAVGFREFPKDARDADWYGDVDSGPVLAGHGIAASAFGVGAARVNGRFDQAYPLAAEMLAVSWPLPDGTLAMPRLLSDAVDAPFLGEAAILYALSRLPAPGVPVVRGGDLPLFVAIVLGGTFGLALVGGLAVLLYLRGRRRREGELPWPRLQLALWLASAAGTVASAAAGHPIIAAACALAMLQLPWQRSVKSSRSV